jgi:two-component system KDP operon response regulator KdpE
MDDSGVVIVDLLRSPGRLLGRQQILAVVWGPGYDRAAGNLRLYMTQLRRKLEPDPARPIYAPCLSAATASG